jgi:penicillin-binding protein 1A
MDFNGKRALVINIMVGVLFSFAVIMSVLLGLALASTQNVINLDDLDVRQSALPTQVFDVNNNLICEFFSDEKRQIVSLDDVPDHLIHAILTREDQDFYNHKGFNIKRIFGAAFDLITGRFSGGASTITQQVAGNRYCDRKEKTMTRKAVELWYAFQLERQFTKREILEFYINEVPFGGGTNGVEAASKFYFGHSAKNLTLAESVLLANVIARPTLYSPLIHPEIAKSRQKEILKQMVSLGYANQAEADRSYREYWANYDYTRARSSADMRQDKAPWFSWYVKDQLEELHLSSDDILKGGLKVYTTLNLEYQEIADKIMENSIKDIREALKGVDSTRQQFGDNVFLPVIDLLALSYNITDLRTAGNKERAKAENYYQNKINPIIDILASSFNLDEVKECSVSAYKKQTKKNNASEVEGALAAIDSKSGAILAMVGGSYFDSRTNWFNRAAYARVQPGSTFKPFYYSAAIDTKKITPATMLIDAPVVFWNDDGTPYTPMNYKGKWYGRVLTRYALARSLNIPALKILETVGFDDAIDYASKMLGITDPSEIERNFPRKFPIGLGILWVSPLQMVRGFATFPNDGKEVTPLAIRYIEDRNGKIIMEPEKDLRAEQKRKGNAIHLMSPQSAYIMTDMLRSSVDYGTLVAEKWRFRDRPIAGKSGTTQNWADAWAVGFTPQVTAAIWFGFDKPGKSFGTELYGGTAAGPAWGQFMQRVHKNLPVKEFSRPASGLVSVEICKVSGQLPDPDGACAGETMPEIFISGTQPSTYCQIHSKGKAAKTEIMDTLRNDMYTEDFDLDQAMKDREKDKQQEAKEKAEKAKDKNSKDTGTKKADDTSDTNDAYINPSQENPLLNGD